MKRKAGRPQSGPGPSISADCPWLPVRAIKLIPVLIRRDDQMIASDTRNISGNKSSLLHTAQATAVNPTSDPRQTLNSIPPCSINHQSSIMTTPQLWKFDVYLLQQWADCWLACSSHSRLPGSSSRSTESEWKLVRSEARAAPAANTRKRSQRRGCPDCWQSSARMRDLMGVVVGWCWSPGAQMM